MIKFPEDKPQKPRMEPHNYFIYGRPMSGKTFFASYFPHALDINTDKNAEQSRIPDIQLLTNKKTGKPVKDVIGRLDSIIKDIPNHSFQTIVIDVIEDVVAAVTKQITEDAGEKYINDGKLSYGKGGSAVKQVIEGTVLDLKALPVNVIWISREEERTDFNTGTSEIVPALKPKYYNIVAGNCDLVIHTQKFGKDHYTRTVTNKRAAYKPEDISDPTIKKLLQSCKGMF